MSQRLNCLFGQFTQWYSNRRLAEYEKDPTIVTPVTTLQGPAEETRYFLRLDNQRGTVIPDKAENMQRLRALNVLAEENGELLLDLNDSNVILNGDGLLMIIDCNFLPSWLRWTLGATSGDSELGAGMTNLYGQGRWIDSDLPAQH